MPQEHSLEFRAEDRIELWRASFKRRLSLFEMVKSTRIVFRVVGK